MSAELHSVAGSEGARAECGFRWQDKDNNHWCVLAVPHREHVCRQCGSAVFTRGEATDAEVERSCEIMHDAYEAAAASEGWETQEASRKPWVDVPEANKRTMRYAVRTLLEARS